MATTRSGNLRLNSQPAPAPTSSSSSSGVYSLKWNNFQTHVATGLRLLLDDDEYTDVTLACEGQFIKAHKLLLSLCSSFFKRLFQLHNVGNNRSDTIVILNQVRFKDLENIIRFIYNGEVNVANADLTEFLQTGQLLQIVGLTPTSAGQNVGDEGDYDDDYSDTESHAAEAVGSPHVGMPNIHSTTVQAHKRKRSADDPNNTEMTSSIQRKHVRLTRASRRNLEVSSCAVTNEESNTPGLPVDEEIDPLLTDISEANNLFNETQPSGGIVSINEVKSEIEHYIIPTSGPVQRHQYDLNNEDGNNLGEENFVETGLDTTDADVRGVYNDGEPGTSRRSRIDTSNVSKRKSGVLTRNQKAKYRKCKYCKASIYRSNISRHMATLHPHLLLADGKGLFLCSICKGTYRTAGHLKLHLKKHKNRFANKTVNNDVHPENTFNRKDDGTILLDPLLYGNLSVEYINFQSNEGEVNEDDSNENAHNFSASNNQANQPALCVICGKHFKNINSLRVHKSIIHRGLRAPKK